jgi:hypothetical protein
MRTLELKGQFKSRGDAYFASRHERDRSIANNIKYDWNLAAIPSSAPSALTPPFRANGRRFRKSFLLESPSQLSIYLFGPVQLERSTCPRKPFRALSDAKDTSICNLPKST